MPEQNDFSPMPPTSETMSQADISNLMAQQGLVSDPADPNYGYETLETWSKNRVGFTESVKQGFKSFADRVLHTPELYGEFVTSAKAEGYTTAQANGILAAEGVGQALYDWKVIFSGITNMPEELVYGIGKLAGSEYAKTEDELDDYGRYIALRKDADNKIGLLNRMSQAGSLITGKEFEAHEGLTNLAKMDVVELASIPLDPTFWVGAGAFKAGGKISTFAAKGSKAAGKGLRYIPGGGRVLDATGSTLRVMESPITSYLEAQGRALRAASGVTGRAGKLVEGFTESTVGKAAIPLGAAYITYEQTGNPFMALLGGSLGRGVTKGFHLSDVSFKSQKISSISDALFAAGEVSSGMATALQIRKAPGFGRVLEGIARGDIAVGYDAAGKAIYGLQSKAAGKILSTRPTQLIADALTIGDRALAGAFTDGVLGFVAEGTIEGAGQEIGEGPLMALGGYGFSSAMGGVKELVSAGRNVPLGHLARMPASDQKRRAATKLINDFATTLNDSSREHFNSLDDDQRWALTQVATVARAIPLANRGNDTRIEFASPEETGTIFASRAFGGDVVRAWKTDIDNGKTDGTYEVSSRDGSKRTVTSAEIEAAHKGAQNQAGFAIMMENNEGGTSPTMVINTATADRKVGNVVRTFTHELAHAMTMVRPLDADLAFEWDAKMNLLTDEFNANYSDEQVEAMYKSQPFHKKDATLEEMKGYVFQEWVAESTANAVTKAMQGKKGLRGTFDSVSAKNDKARARGKAISGIDHLGRVSKGLKKTGIDPRLPPTQRVTAGGVGAGIFDPDTGGALENSATVDAIIADWLAVRDDISQKYELDDPDSQKLARDYNLDEVQNIEWQQSNAHILRVKKDGTLDVDKDGTPKPKTKAVLDREASQHAKIINETLDSVEDPGIDEKASKDDRRSLIPMRRLEGGDWQGEYFTPNQIKALEAQVASGNLPKSVLDKVLELNDMMLQNPGRILFLDYYASLKAGPRGPKYSPKIGVTNRPVSIFGFTISQAGNFLVTLMDMGAFDAALKVEAKKSNSSILKPFKGNVAEFTAAMRTMMDGYMRGDPVPGAESVGADQRDAINAFIGILTKETPGREVNPNPLRGKSTGAKYIKKFRLDRIAGMTPSDSAGFFFDYGKSMENFSGDVMPRSRADLALQNLDDQIPKSMTGDQFKSWALKNISWDYKLNDRISALGGRDKVTREDVEKALEGNVLTSVELTGDDAKFSAWSSINEYSGNENFDHKEVVVELDSESLDGFQSSHYPKASNPVFHFRRTILPTGEYILEEIQSDWAADKDRDDAPMRNPKHYAPIAIRMALRDAVNNGAKKILIAGGDVQRERYGLMRKVSSLSKSGTGYVANYEGTRVSILDRDTAIRSGFPEEALDAADQVFQERQGQALETAIQYESNPETFRRVSSKGDGKFEIQSAEIWTRLNGIWTTTTFTGNSKTYDSYADAKAEIEAYEEIGFGEGLIFDNTLQAAFSSPSDLRSFYADRQNKSRISDAYGPTPDTGAFTVGGGTGHNIMYDSIIPKAAQETIKKIDNSATVREEINPLKDYKWLGQAVEDPTYHSIEITDTLREGVSNEDFTYYSGDLNDDRLSSEEQQSVDIYNEEISEKSDSISRQRARDERDASDKSIAGKRESAGKTSHKEIQDEFGSSARESVTTEKGYVTGTGERTRSFFSSVTKGDEKHRPNVADQADLSVVNLPAAAQQAGNVRRRYSGAFDMHIGASIPGFEDAQSAKVLAIGEMFASSPGAKMLDIGGSEGSTLKAINVVSGGKVAGLNLEPNPDMRDTMSKDPVDGVEFENSLWGSKAQRGDFLEIDGESTPYFDPGDETFDVVHESMVFQFIDAERADKIKAVKEVMKPDGIAVIEEKVFTPNWEKNEVQKDEFKRQHFAQSTLDKKAEEVLVGMEDYMSSQSELEKVLGQNFKHVAQYWSSGNFAGYVGSDSLSKVNQFLDALPDLNSQFSDGATPAFVNNASLSGDMIIRSSGLEASVANQLQPKMNAGQFNSWIKKVGSKWTRFYPELKKIQDSLTPKEVSAPSPLEVTLVGSSNMNDAVERARANIEAARFVSEKSVKAMTRIIDSIESGNRYAVDLIRADFQLSEDADESPSQEGSRLTKKQVGENSIEGFLVGLKRLRKFADANNLIVSRNAAKISQWLSENPDIGVLTGSNSPHNDRYYRFVDGQQINVEPLEQTQPQPERSSVTKEEVLQAIKKAPFKIVSQGDIPQTNEQKHVRVRAEATAEKISGQLDVIAKDMETVIFGGLEVAEGVVDKYRSEVRSDYFLKWGAPAFLNFIKGKLSDEDVKLHHAMGTENKLGINTDGAGRLPKETIQLLEKMRDESPAEVKEILNYQDQLDTASRRSNQLRSRYNKVTSLSPENADSAYEDYSSVSGDELGVGDYVEHIVTFENQDAQKPYKHNHWDGVKNPAMHVRRTILGERDFESLTGEQGESAYIIDEIQSDWSRGRPEDAPVKKMKDFVDAGLRIALKEAAIQNLTQVWIPTGDVHKDRYNLRNYVSEITYNGSFYTVFDRDGQDIETGNRDRMLELGVPNGWVETAAEDYDEVADQYIDENGLMIVEATEVLQAEELDSGEGSTWQITSENYDIPNYIREDFDSKGEADDFIESQGFYYNGEFYTDEADAAAQRAEYDLQGAVGRAEGEDLVIGDDKGSGHDLLYNKVVPRALSKMLKKLKTDSELSLHELDGNNDERATTYWVAGLDTKTKDIIKSDEWTMFSGDLDESGDQTDTPEFKSWFGDSKVVDADGNPLVVYHGTRGDFNTFKFGGAKGFDAEVQEWTDSEGRTRTVEGDSGKGFFFGADPSNLPAAHNFSNGRRAGSGDNIMPVYLNIKNPLVITPENRDEMVEKYAQGFKEFPELITNQAKLAMFKEGIDGIFLSHEKKSNAPDEYIALDSKNIKSATGNSGEFGTRTRDIRFSGDINTPEFKSWFGDSKVVDADGSPLEVFHGTDADFNEFVASVPKTFVKNAKDLKGIYFSDDPQAAGSYARGGRRRAAGGSNPRLISAYLSMQNPLDITDPIRNKPAGQSFGDAKREALKSLTDKHDGVVFRGNDFNKPEYIVFESNQVKSSRENIGTFDPTNPDIRFSGDTSATIEENASINESTRQASGIQELSQISKSGDTLPDVESMSGATLEVAARRLRQSGFAFKTGKDLIGYMRTNPAAYNITAFRDILVQSHEDDMDRERRIMPEFTSISTMKMSGDLPPIFDADGMMPVTHYGSPNIKKFRPQRHGTGIAGEESARKRNYPEIYKNRNYVGTVGYEPEPGLPTQESSTYKFRIDPSIVYDLDKDPAGFWTKVGRGMEEGRAPYDEYAPMDQAAKITMVEAEVEKAGYAGYVSPSRQAAAIFASLPVEGDVTLERYAELFPGKAKKLGRFIDSQTNFSGDIIPIAPGQEGGGMVGVDSGAIFSGDLDRSKVVPGARLRYKPDTRYVSEPVVWSTDKFLDELSGQSGIFMPADRMRAGLYEGLHGDIEPIMLRGGPDYPYLHDNEGKSAWASDWGAVPGLMNRAEGQGDIAMIMLMSEGNIRGNRTFWNTYMTEVEAAVRRGDVSKTRALSILNAARVNQAQKVRKKARDARESNEEGLKAQGRINAPWFDAWSREWKTLEAARQAGQGTIANGQVVPASFRNDAFWSSYSKAKGNTGGLGTFQNVNQGMPDVFKMIGMMEDSAYKNVPMGDIVGAIRIKKGGRRDLTHSEAGIPEHGSYALAIEGEPIAKLDRSISAQNLRPDVFEDRKFAAAYRSMTMKPYSVRFSGDTSGLTEASGSAKLPPQSKTGAEMSIVKRVKNTPVAKQSMEEIESIVKGGGWAALSAENPGDTDLDDVTNLGRHLEMRDLLNASGVEYIEMVGKYNRLERSFLIPEISERQAFDIADKFGQQSILTKDGFVYMDGKENRELRDESKDRWGVAPSDDDNFFSVVPASDGDYGFEIGLDFSLVD